MCDHPHRGPRTVRFPVQSNWTDCTLDHVAVHLDGAVVKEQLQAAHVFGNVAELFSKT